VIFGQQNIRSESPALPSFIHRSVLESINAEIDIYIYIYMWTLALLDVSHLRTARFSDVLISFYPIFYI
jgi:hypothetical protein